MNKKILYIFEGSLNQYNSVIDILYSLLKQFDDTQYEQVLASYRGTPAYPLKVENTQGYKSYSVTKCTWKQLISNDQLSTIQKISYSLKSLVHNCMAKIPRIRHIYRCWEYNRFYDKIFRLEKPDIVVYFAISPEKGFSRVCKRRNIPYISMLFDTFIDRPHITQKEAAIENDEIVNALGYFVPDFFMDGYRKHYDHQNIYPFKLPLLIPKDNVLQAYKNVEKTLDFTYFGQLQSFRNGDRIKEIFKELGATLDIFSTEKHPSDNTYIFHNAVSQEALYKTVASSDFLVAFDNSKPYDQYLPSKAYLYVSFTKPIIVFGDNKDSALRRFLAEYPLSFYYDINESSLDDLKAFIEEKHNGFSEELYEKFIDYLPQQALHQIVTLIKDTIC